MWVLNLDDPLVRKTWNSVYFVILARTWHSEEKRILEVVIVLDNLLDTSWDLCGYLGIKNGVPGKGAKPVESKRLDFWDKSVSKAIVCATSQQNFH